MAKKANSIPAEAAKASGGPKKKPAKAPAKAASTPAGKVAKPAPAKAAAAKPAAPRAAKPAAGTKAKSAAATAASGSRAKAGPAPADKAASAAIAPQKKQAPGKAPAKKADAKKASANKPAAPAAPAERKTSPKPAAKPAGKAEARAKAGSAAKSAPKQGASAKDAGKKAAAAAKSAAKPSKAATAGAGTAKQPASASRPASTRGAKTAAAEAAKPWVGSYPDGIPAEIGALQHSSLGDLMVESCRRYASRPAFTCMDKSLTFAELERLSTDFAAFLQSKGLAKGARVALMMPNILQYPVAMMAVLRAGYVVVNVNPLYTARELEHQLKDSGAEAIVVLENFAHTVEATMGKTDVKHVVVASMGDLMGLKGFIVNFVVRRMKKMVPAWSLPGHVAFNDAVRQGKSKTFRPPRLAQEDIAFLQYTGGTTGVAKGAMLTHGNILANVAQNAAWVEAAFSKRARPERLVYICALPLYHIYALTVNAMMGIQQGAENVLIPNPRDIPGFVKDLKKHPFHMFPGLNTLFNALLNNEDFRKLDFSAMILTFGGGMAVQSGVAERWKKLTGITIAEGYGLSETSPVATANRFDGGEFTGTIGLPLPSTDISIRDDKGGALPTGEVGEICIRGPQVMQGYWNRPDETKKVMTKDGFFRSGDMGFMDERGYIKIVDRKKDMILVSGFNVYPNELEDVVSKHPGVLEVAAVGVPDEHSGEAPKLFVVRKDPNLTEDEVIAFARENLTGYKRPRHVEFRDELPKTNVGKILRRELR